MGAIFMVLTAEGGCERWIARRRAGLLNASTLSESAGELITDSAVPTGGNQRCRRRLPRWGKWGLGAQFAGRCPGLSPSVPLARGSGHYDRLF